MTTMEAKRLYRSRNDRMVSGVAAGLGEFLGIDATIIRLLFAFGTLFAGPFPLFVYIVMMLVVPEEPFASVSDGPAVEIVEPQENEEGQA